MTVEWGTVYARLLEQGLLVMGADVRQQIMIIQIHSASWPQHLPLESLGC